MKHYSEEEAKKMYDENVPICDICGEFINDEEPIVVPTPGPKDKGKPPKAFYHKCCFEYKSIKDGR